MREGQWRPVDGENLGQALGGGLAHGGREASSIGMGKGMGERYRHRRGGRGKEGGRGWGFRHKGGIQAQGMGYLLYGAGYCIEKGIQQRGRCTIVNTGEEWCRLPGCAHTLKCHDPFYFILFGGV